MYRSRLLRLSFPPSRLLCRRSFSHSPRPLLHATPFRLGPPPPASPASPSSPVPSILSDREYHDKANEYLDHVVAQYEDLQDSREDIDVEFSSGVLTIIFARQGTYVINKQPPNKQIWLSSPLTGPRRFDYVSAGPRAGHWICMRDGSSLADILREETGVDVHS
ncbi:hypothetical protein TD95_005098 [Thielaviopsis punctulata]|uniref:ferroxidase n=1 Tax=Thielaviopsis punctulata TaxID=72032 RepID=A0A0F4Z720_9PEZI|nr:hypothetical protein TD95_005098 [Thielaviopsis punctulata]